MCGIMRDMMATGHMGWINCVNVALLAVLLIRGLALFKYNAFP